MNTDSEESAKLLVVIQEKLADKILHAQQSLGDAEIVIRGGDLLEVCAVLKSDPALDFAMLLNVTAVDYMDKDIAGRVSDTRFELVYHFLSLKQRVRLRMKIALAEKEPSIDSVVSLWPAADFMESEVWDMYGIRFDGHPDLRRILMYDEFKGYPLRKDYPVQGKQPRIPLRAPEVENTARLMERKPLVQINKKSSAAPLRELGGSNG